MKTPTPNRLRSLSQSQNISHYSENWNADLLPDDESDCLRKPSGIQALFDKVKPDTKAPQLALVRHLQPQRGWLSRVKSQRQVEKLFAVSPSEKAAEYLTKKETAELLRLSLGTIHNLIKSRALKVVRIGRTVRISRKEIDEFTSQRTVNSKR